MKKHLLFLLLMLCLSPVQASEPMRLCQDDVDVYPWHMASGQGLSNIMLKQVAERLRVSIETESMPWKRCLAMVQKGQIDGAIAASFTPERMTIGAYPLNAQQKPDRNRRMSDETYALFVLNGNPEGINWDGKTLAKTAKPVAAQLGYSAVELLRKMAIDVDDSDKKPELLLRKLQMHNVSAAVLNTREATRLLKNPAFSGKITRLEPPLLSREAYLLFSHQFEQEHPNLVERFWDEIAKVRESASYQNEMIKMLGSSQ